MCAARPRSRDVATSSQASTASSPAPQRAPNTPQQHTPATDAAFEPFSEPPASAAAPAAAAPASPTPRDRMHRLQPRPRQLWRSASVAVTNRLPLVARNNSIGLPQPELRLADASLQPETALRPAHRRESEAGARASEQGALANRARKRAASACGSCSACGAPIKVVLRGVQAAEDGVESHRLRLMGSDGLLEGVEVQPAQWRASLYAALTYLLNAAWHVVVMACIAYAVLWVSSSAPAM